MMVSSLLFLLVHFATVAFASPLLELETRQAVTTLSASQVTGYKTYSNYAAAGYCTPDKTLAWNCGAKCSANPNFVTIASGGNGITVQYWFVGYDSALKSIIVSYQGTDPSKIVPVITDINIFFQPLRSDLFPGVSSSIQTHNGFGDAHAASATAVLAAVRSALTRFDTTTVTLTGHSLGGAIAIIATAYLSVNLPSSTSFRTITYSNPRVGNQAFVDFVNARSVMNRVDNKHDIVPILPGRALGYAHTEGEIHILNSNAWVNCPGQDNTGSDCTIGYVPSILDGTTSDHDGPFDGVTMGC